MRITNDEKVNDETIQLVGSVLDKIEEAQEILLKKALEL